MKSQVSTSARPERWRVVQSVSSPTVADKLQPPPPPPSLTFGPGSPPIAVTFVLPYGSICPPDRNMRSRPPRAARSKSSSKRSTCEARRISASSFDVAGMNAGSGSSAYVEPSTRTICGAWQRLATYIATCAHGLPNPWKTISPSRIVRARATQTHSSIVNSPGLMRRRAPSSARSSPATR